MIINEKFSKNGAIKNFESCQIYENLATHDFENKNTKLRNRSEDRGL